MGTVDTEVKYLGNYSRAVVRLMHVRVSGNCDPHRRESDVSSVTWEGKLGVVGSSSKNSNMHAYAAMAASRHAEIFSLNSCPACV